MEACKTAKTGCEFVEREGCHGRLQGYVAVRYGLKPSDSEMIWLWQGQLAPVNVLSYLELRQLATVFNLGKIKALVREHEFNLQMSLDQNFEGIVVLTPENAPLLMTPGSAYAERRSVVLKELQLLRTYLGKIDRLCRYVYDPLACTTDEAPFNALVRDIDADLAYNTRATSFHRMDNLVLHTVVPELEPRDELTSGTKSGMNFFATLHSFNTWIKLPEVDSPIYHQHQKFVDRFPPFLLEQQQCHDKEKQLQAAQVLKSDAQAKTQSPSNDEPPAKRSRSAASGSDS